MLNGILITVVPMVVTLAAAFFLFRRANRNNDTFHFGGAGHPAGPRPSSDHPQPSGSGVVRRRVGAPLMEDALFPSECSVCFERQCDTELYPCGHRDICAECVDTIVSKLNAECPFCRRGIAAVNYY